MSYPQTILLTDDEAHIRKFIGLILRKFDNPRILEAGDGAQAVALYREHRPDLVLLDVNMPRLDGVQALAQIRALDGNAVVIMLTSLANRHTVEECLRYVWNLKIPVCLSGMDSEKALLENIGYARAWKPEGKEAIDAILAKVHEIAGDGRLERFKSTQDFDSDVHRDQHKLG